MKVCRNTKSIVVLLTIVMTMSIFSGSAFADGGWKCDSVGWWYETNGSYYMNEWAEIGGEWYHFNSRGYMETNCYRGGYWLRSNGTWDRNFSHGTWKSNSAGWWYEDNGWYPKNTWLWIDGERYYFDSKGYMEHDCYRDGCWLKSNGMWDQNYSHGTWKSNSNGWWYEDNGWYPKNKWLQIDGTRYYFDNKGYSSNTSNNRTVHLVLDGMSANEVVANLRNLTKVSSSDKWNAYINRIEAGDLRIYLRSDSTFSADIYTDSVENGHMVYSQAKNYIQYFRVEGIYENMDGTTVVSNNVYAEVKLRIDDYDFAVELYDKFIEVSSTTDRCEAESNRTGTTWNSRFSHSYQDTNSSGNITTQKCYYDISLSKSSGSFTICTRVY